MPQNASQNYEYPPGTRGIPDETIESARYNDFLDDLVVNDLNIPRPVHRGGTGATTADEALINLGAEKATQLVTNYDTHVWLPGSFRSAGSATAGPVDGHAFAGIVYLSEPFLDPPTNANVVVSARDVDDTVVPSRVYVREKKANVWGAWTVVDASTLPFPPGGDLSATTILAAIQELDAEKASIVYVDDGFNALIAGVDAADATLQAADAALQLDVDARVLRTGDTMTGLLALSGDPTTDLQAATKRYVDVRTAALGEMAYLSLQTNGAFTVNQGYPVGIFNSLVGLTRMTDGWKVSHMNTASRSQVDVWRRGMNIFSHHSVSTLVPAAGDAIFVSTAIEGYRFARMGWGNSLPATFIKTPITVGFFSRHHTPGLYCVVVRNAALTASYITTYTQAVADEEEYHTFTVPPETANIWESGSNAAVNIVFTIAAGSNFVGTAGSWLSGNKLTVAGAVNATDPADWFRITGVIIVPGSFAPAADSVPFLMRPFDEEFMLCQRYFQRYTSSSGATILATGLAFNATTGIFPIRFPTQMRAPPTLDTTIAPANFLVLGASGTGGAASAMTMTNSVVEGARIEFTAPSLVAGQALTLQAASFPTSITFMAEL